MPFPLLFSRKGIRFNTVVVFLRNGYPPCHNRLTAFFQTIFSTLEIA